MKIFIFMSRFFAEIQSTTSIVGTEDTFYAVFNTPENSIAGSAVCSFSLRDVTRTFEESPFKNQVRNKSSWRERNEYQAHFRPKRKRSIRTGCRSTGRIRPTLVLENVTPEDEEEEGRRHRGRGRNRATTTRR